MPTTPKASNDEGKLAEAKSENRMADGDKKRTRDSSKLRPGLYVVATPIGNLADLSPRAIETLRAVDTIACEDTRRTGQLLKKIGISNRMTAYHDHSNAGRRASLINRLNAGEAVALVSDAGTPCIADPGFKLVRDAIEQGVEVFALPGPNAAIAALSISGLPTDRFMFEGFLPAKSNQRQTRLGEMVGLSATLVFYESGQRLADMLKDAENILGNRRCAVAREITKLHEQVRRGTLHELARDMANEATPKGEIVVLIEGPDKHNKHISKDEIDALLLSHLETLPPRKAAREVAAISGGSTSELYDRILELKSLNS